MGIGPNLEIRLVRDFINLFDFAFSAWLDRENTAKRNRLIAANWPAGP